MGSISSKNIGRSEKKWGPKTSKIEDFGVWWLATGSYSVEIHRTTSRKPLEAFPGLQDLKNGPKTSKKGKHVKKHIFAVFSAVFFPLKGLFGVTAVVMVLWMARPAELKVAQIHGILQEHGWCSRYRSRVQPC